MKTVKYFVILKLIFLSDLVLSFATWNKGRERPQKQESVEVEKTDNGKPDCSSSKMVCKMMEEACINDCQRGQAHGMGFCTTFGAASAPVVLGYSEAIETSDRNIYLTMLFKSLEGILWAASAYCGSEAGLLTCDYCGAGVEFLDVLEAQNKTMENLEAVKEVVKNFDREVINISVTASKYFELGDGIRDVLKYDELLQQTDELLYW